MAQIPCKFCGKDVPFENDALEKLIDAGYEKPSASLLISEHRHLKPTGSCAGDPEARNRLSVAANKESIGDCQ